MKKNKEIQTLLEENKQIKVLLRQLSLRLSGVEEELNILYKKQNKTRRDLQYVGESSFMNSIRVQNLQNKINSQ